LAVAATAEEDFQGGVTLAEVIRSMAADIAGSETMAGIGDLVGFVDMVDSETTTIPVIGAGSATDSA
jgi:hypothetical protein